MKIAIVNGNPGSYASKEFKMAIEARNCECVFIDPVKTIMVLNRINEGKNKLQSIGSEPIPHDIDLFIPRLSGLTTYKHVLYHMSEVLGIYSPVNIEGLMSASDKMRTLQRASMLGLRVPKTVLITNTNDIQAALEKTGTPCIIKNLNGSKGIGVVKADSFASAQSMIQSLIRYSKPLIIEEFISEGNKDIRAIVVGNKVIAAMERSASKGDFRANLSQGGSGKAINLDKYVERFCIEAAKSLPLEIAGVDIIMNKHGEPVLIEVNGNHGFGIQKKTGIDIAGETISYAIKKYESRRNSEAHQYASNSLLNDAYIIKCYNAVIGHNVSYSDREGIKRSMQINSLEDFQHLVTSTFKMQL